MIKVLITIGRLERGGAEMRLLDLLGELKARGIPLRPIVYIVSGQTGALDERFRLVGARLIFGRPRLTGLGHFYHVLRQEQPGVVHANASLAAGIYLAVAALAGVRWRFAHMRSTGYNDLGIGRAAKDTVYRFLMNKFATRVVGVCDATRDFARTPSSKWQTIYNGIRLPELVRTKVPHRLELLVMGRLSYEKNPARMLPVVERLLARLGNGVRLRFVGVGPLAGPLEAEVASRGLNATVKITGATDKPVEIAATASVLLLTSRREGLPGAILEALAVGTPVVATDLPGVREIARLVVGVSVMAPDATDEEWANTILIAATADRSKIARSFASSPFQLHAHVDSMTMLWLGQIDQ